MNAGKGDKRRKSTVPNSVFSENWDRIFNKSVKEKGSTSEKKDLPVNKSKTVNKN